MSKWTSEAEARNQIKDLVKDYYEAFKKPEQEKEFKPGDRLSYASEYMMKKKCAVLLSGTGFLADHRKIFR